MPVTAARFFRDRLFGDRMVRGERDFGAMIPPTPAGLTMPWPGRGSHAEGPFPLGDRPAANLTAIRN